MEELTFNIPNVRGQLDLKRHLRKSLCERYSIKGYDSTQTTVEGQTLQDKIVDSFIIMLFKDELPQEDKE